MQPLARSIAVAVALLAVAACSDDESRPGVAGWEPAWEATAAATFEVPPDGAEADGLDDECNALLTAAREARPELLPSPADSVDELVDEWLTVAESVGFECTEHEDLEGALAELAQLEGSISTALDALRNAG